MNIEVIEKRFSSHMEKNYKLSDLAPFLRSYVRLLLIFKDELPSTMMRVLLERQKQLLGYEFNGESFDEMRDLSRKGVENDLEVGADAIKQSSLNRLFFCALLDTEESDFFYLTEPLFEFARRMEVSPELLKQILESEFVGLKV